jgi:hypothetical protein
MLRQNWHVYDNFLTKNKSFIVYIHANSKPFTSRAYPPSIIRESLSVSKSKRTQSLPQAEGFLFLHFLLYVYLYLQCQFRSSPSTNHATTIQCISRAMMKSRRFCISCCAIKSFIDRCSSKENRWYARISNKYGFYEMRMTTCNRTDGAYLKNQYDIQNSRNSRSKTNQWIEYVHKDSILPTSWRFLSIPDPSFRIFTGACFRESDIDDESSAMISRVIMNCSAK